MHNNEELLPEYDLDYSKSKPNRFAEKYHKTQKQKQLYWMTMLPKTFRVPNRSMKRCVSWFASQRKIRTLCKIN